MEPSDQGIGQTFQCGICLDLVYKPIVQSCGHIFCFWCAHRAMNTSRKSHCPVCRHPYTHFRRVCEMLHFFLERATPEEYGRRAQETHDMEQSSNVFSPRILESPRKEGKQISGTSPTSPGLLDGEPRQASVLTVADSSPMPCGCRANGGVYREGTCPERTMGSAATASVGEEVEGDEQPTEQENEDGWDKGLSAEHFSCAACRKFLYRPIVFSCGQVFCESCVKGSSSSAYCVCCENPHPEGSVQVCLELHDYLERTFTDEYIKRREEVLSQQQIISERETLYFSDAEDPWSEEDEAADSQIVHVRVGCDGCGMYPIVGEWYHCVNCREKIGYDLCGGCQRKGSSIAGRFDQQHGPEHRMVLKHHSGAADQIVTLNLSSGTIQRRRQLQIPDDLDEYIESFM